MMVRSESDGLLSEIPAVAMRIRTVDDLRSQVLLSRLVGSDRDCSQLTGHPKVETGRRQPRPEDLLIGLGLKTKASVSGK
jgi:hypothetical protein